MDAKEYYKKTRLVETRKWTLQMALNFADEFYEAKTKQLHIPVVSNILKDKEAPTLKDAFIAGYKKRAEMSGLKYDDVSELNAITCFKCWKSFDL